MSYKHISTKKWGHERGLSCCFRQWRSTHSHCSLLHGYALSVEVMFGANELDERNWVVDFGGLDEFKAWLEDMFDHTTLVAKDDPQLHLYQVMKDSGLIDLRILDNVGCEATAELIFKKAVELYEDERVKVLQVIVQEHDSNGARYVRTEENAKPIWKTVKYSDLDDVEQYVGKTARICLDEGADVDIGTVVTVHSTDYSEGMWTYFHLGMKWYASELEVQV